MNWFKIAESDNIVKKIKSILKEHSFTKLIANYYNISPQEIDDNLAIEICELEGKFAEGNGQIIRINEKLLDKEFFKSHFHFVIHEFFHWVKRRSEQKFYFNDPEETQSFVLQMAWDLIQGKSEKEVSDTILPILQGHYKNKSKVGKVFNEMLNKALNLYRAYQEGGEFSI